MGVIVKEALANGRLTPADPTAPVAMEAALGAALAQPWADVVLSGASTVAQLCSHVAVLREPPPEIDPAIAEAPEDYWRTRAQLPWT
jgi:aryl-alcohol dehydrogenase-like predicted oxidoreductase